MLNIISYTTYNGCWTDHIVSLQKQVQKNNKHIVTVNNWPKNRPTICPSVLPSVQPSTYATYHSEFTTSVDSFFYGQDHWCHCHLCHHTHPHHHHQCVHNHPNKNTHGSHHLKILATKKSMDQYNNNLRDSINNELKWTELNSAELFDRILFLIFSPVNTGQWL